MVKLKEPPNVVEFSPECGRPGHSNVQNRQALK